VRPSRLLYPALLAFTVTLAAIVGWRLSADALPVVLGVIAGVAASIPTSLLIAWVATHVALDRYAARNPYAVPPQTAAPAPEPRVIVVQTPAQPPAQSPSPASSLSPSTSHLSSPPRTFTLLGRDDEIWE
jgi:hypothetical protein